MKYIPILFSTEMLQAILEGRKTKTRRLSGLKLQNQDPSKWIIGSDPYWSTTDKKYDRMSCDFITPDEKEMNTSFCRYGKPGDILWVRETWAPIMDINGKKALPDARIYKTDYLDYPVDWKWKPSIHMPKAACRLFLQVKSVRVERLHDISEDDAKTEGVHQYDDGTFKNYFKKKGLREMDGVECLSARASFESLWISINGIGNWILNPWVWVIEFERIEKPENW